jgi:hypothetical protein
VEASKNLQEACSVHLRHQERRARPAEACSAVAPTPRHKRQPPARAQEEAFSALPTIHNNSNNNHNKGSSRQEEGFSVVLGRSRRLVEVCLGTQRVNRSNSNNQQQVVYLEHQQPRSQPRQRAADYLEGRWVGTLNSNNNRSSSSLSRWEEVSSDSHKQSQREVYCMSQGVKKDCERIDLTGDI